MKREIDALDRALVSALQIYPRASWSQLAPVLQTSESTLSRRWDQLTADGVVWTSSGILPDRPVLLGQICFIEIRCEMGLRESVIEALSALPNVFGIVVCAGAHDIAITVINDSMLEMDRYVHQYIVPIEGVALALTTYISGFTVEGSMYRLGNLTEQQAKSIAALAPPRRTITSRPTPAQTEIAFSLGHDVRRPAVEIARETGLSRAHVQRQIAVLQSAPWYLSRIDFSVNDFGLTAVYFWVECSATHMPDLMRFVRRSHGVRVAMPVVSRANVLLAVWLPGLEHISGFEQHLVRSVPAVNVLDRWPQISARKRLGVILDRYGRRASGSEAATESGAIGTAIAGARVGENVSARSVAAAWSEGGSDFGIPVL